MKKFYLALMAVAAIAFTSCGKDNGNNPNDPNENQEETPKYASVEYNFTATISDAFASVADLRLVYTDEDGTLTEETFNGSMSDIVIKTKVPVDSICVQVFYAKKEKADFTENNLYLNENAKGDKFMKIEYKFDGTYKTMNEKGDVIERESLRGFSGSKSMKITEVERYIEEYSTTKAIFPRTIRFDSKGYEL